MGFLSPRFMLTAALGAFLATGAMGDAKASLINGDFETGDLTGWTSFTTTNGDLGGIGFPGVGMYDTDNDSVETFSALFRVGRASFDLGGRRGGGIFQDVALDAGSLTITLDIAAQAVSGNADAGLFELMLDGIVVDSHDFGSISAGAAEYASLSATESVSAGTHEIRIRMGRNYIQNGTTPLQYVDNVLLTGSALEDVDAETDIEPDIEPDVQPTNDPQPTSVPEPAGLAMFGIGLLGLGYIRRRRAA